MEKIKKWFIDDINFHLVAAVGVTIIAFIARPSLGQFGLQMFGYFGTYFFIKVLSGGKKMSEIPWEDNIRNMSIGIIRNKTSTTINQNFKGDVNDFKMFDELEKKILRKSNWHERLESLAKERKAKYEPETFTTGFEKAIDKAMNNKDLQSIIDNAGDNSSSITVNGKTYRGNGSVSIVNGKVKINGKDVTDESRCENLIVEVKGDVRNLTIEGDATCIINGNVTGNVNSHNLDCGNVGGNVKAHKVKCGHVGGNINAHKVNQ